MRPTGIHTVNVSQSPQFQKIKKYRMMKVRWMYIKVQDGAVTTRIQQENQWRSTTPSVAQPSIFLVCLSAQLCSVLTIQLVLHLQSVRHSLVVCSVSLSVSATRSQSARNGKSESESGIRTNEEAEWGRWGAMAAWASLLRALMRAEGYNFSL